MANYEQCQQAVHLLGAGLAARAYSRSELLQAVDCRYVPDVQADVDYFFDPISTTADMASFPAAVETPVPAVKVETTVTKTNTGTTPNLKFTAAAASTTGPDVPKNLVSGRVNDKLDTLQVDVRRLLSDAAYQEYITNRVTSVAIRQAEHRVGMLAELPIMNRIGAFNVPLTKEQLVTIEHYLRTAVHPGKPELFLALHDWSYLNVARKIGLESNDLNIVWSPGFMIGHNLAFAEDAIGLNTYRVPLQNDATNISTWSECAELGVYLGLEYVAGSDNQFMFVTTRGAGGILRSTQVVSVMAI